MTAYYNENDTKAAQWLRNLIAAGLIAPGDVDERSIEDVRPSDLIGYTQCHFFAGIGVWSHALRRAGWRDERPIWTGSCPCQPFSSAGKGVGFDDERHLWPAWEWLIARAKPRGVPVIGEQVASKAGLAWLDVVQADLEGQGCTVRSVDLCAAGVGAPHIRQRIFFVADAGDVRQRDAEGRGPDAGAPGGTQGEVRAERLRPEPSASVSGAGRMANDDAHGRALGGSPRVHERGQPGNDAAGRSTHGVVAHAERERGCSGEPGRQDAADARQPGQTRATSGFWYPADWLACTDGKARPVEPGTFPLAHGVAARVVRLRAYGNAIVGPLAEEVIRAFILEDLG